MTNDKKTSGAREFWISKSDIEIQRYAGPAVVYLVPPDNRYLEKFIKVVEIKALEAAQKRIEELEASLELALARVTNMMKMYHEVMEKLALSQTSGQK